MVTSKLVKCDCSKHVVLIRVIFRVGTDAECLIKILTYTQLRVLLLVVRLLI